MLRRRLRNAGILPALGIADFQSTKELRARNPRSLGLLSCLFLSSTVLFAQETSIPILPLSPEVLIHAHNAKGTQLRDGLGFIWDDHTVVTSYSAVQGASWIKVQIDDQSAVAGELISWSKIFDVALLHTTEELPEGRTLGSSDTLGSGDSAYLFFHDHGHWKLKEARLKNWEDSGHGFVWLHFPELTSGTPSPLFNQTGKIVGWFPGKSPAIPLKAVFAQLAERSSTVRLSDFIALEKFWNILRVPPRDKKSTEHVGVKKISGPSSFPFEIEIPENWQHETSEKSGHYLLLAISGERGISMGLRVVSAQSGDLNLEMERAEMLLFPGIARRELVPSMAGGISGLRALYDDDQGFISTSFYGLTSGHLCVLSLTHPSAVKTDVLIEELYTSLHLPAE